MDNCLTDYIGIFSGCDDDTPDSGIYINSLPGISLESIDKTANADQITYLGLWADIQSNSFIKFKVDFITAITKCFRITKKCDYGDLICDNKEVLTTAWMNLLGAQIMTYRIYSTRLNRFTTVDKPDAEELLALYQTEYQAALTQAVQLIDVSSCQCMEPGGQISRANFLPW